jgi:hypothetical protein
MRTILGHFINFTVYFNEHEYLTMLETAHDLEDKILDLYPQIDNYRLFQHPLFPWLVVRKRTIPTERPPLVSEASANFCG